MFQPRPNDAVIPALASVLLLLSAPGDHIAAQDVQAAEEAQEAAFVAVFDQSATEVANAVSAVLVGRGELPQTTADPMSVDVREAIVRNQQGAFTSQSISVASAELSDMVAEPARGLIGDAGGRYVLTIVLVPEQGGATRTTVHATLVATIPGAHGPLGGRLLPSNGSMENAVLQAVASALADGVGA